MEQFLAYFVPENYNLNLQIDKNAQAIGGVVTVYGCAENEEIKFHAVNLSIDSVKVDGEVVPFEVADDTLTIKNQKIGDIKVKIRYHAELNKNLEGAYLSYYQYEGKTETIVTTQFESHYAREAFPCIDEPAAKATFDLSITIPEGSDDLILANTPVKSVVKNTTIFETTPRMSTYLLAFIIGHFHGKTIENAHGVKITTYAPLNQPESSVDFANEVAAKSLEYYDDEFGMPYPLPKLDQVALPDFEAGAMENWGLVTYRESMLLADKTSTLDTKKTIALTVTHELSHQWFGDLVTMQWWDDLWLNESFASIMEYMATDYIYPEMKIWEGFFTGDCLSALRRDAYQGVQSVHQDVHNPSDIALLFDGAIVYSKGARLMLMLIRAMGWEKFKLGIRDYFTQYAYGNTVGDNLWDALKPYADFDPKSFMHSWIDRPGYPVLTGDKQQRFLLDGKLTDSNWSIPHVLSDMSGHYIINLSASEFSEKLTHFDELNLEEKLRLLIDRDLIAKTDLVESASLLDLVSKFKHEDSAAVWNIIATIISNLKIFFEPNTDAEKSFKNFVGELVVEKLAEVGLECKEGEDENITRLRSTLLGLDYYAEDKANLEALAKMYNSDLTKLNPEMRAEILDAKIYCEPAIWDEYLVAYQTTADPEVKFDLMFAMALSKDEANVRKTLALLEQTEIIKPQDHFYLFIFLYRNPVARTRTFEWITTHWEFVKGFGGDKSLDHYPRYVANSIRTQEESDKYFAFFESLKEVALERTLEVAHNEINARLKLIASDKKAVQDRL